MAMPVFPNRCNGTQCSRCAECCTDFLPMTRKEVEIIKSYIAKNNILPVNNDGEEFIDVTCCFCDKVNHRCLIYPVRPFVCRNFKCCKSYETLSKERVLYNTRKDLYVNAYVSEDIPKDNSIITTLALFYPSKFSFTRDLNISWLHCKKDKILFDLFTSKFTIIKPGDIYKGGK